LSRSPFSIGVIVLGSGAVLGIIFIVVGYLLPTDWEAEAEHVAALPAEAVFRFLDSPEGWRDWTTWPESGVERSGPGRGEGARLSWDDPELGAGSFTITRVRAPELVEYRVEVEDVMLTQGVITLTEEPAGVRIAWRERGDLGRNPLMGFWGLSMERAQREELVKGLERLETVAAEGMLLAAPADSASASGDAHMH
jgi:uncharacterized protein YndB with AHSA1/START domain